MSTAGGASKAGPPSTTVRVGAEVATGGVAAPSWFTFLLVMVNLPLRRSASVCKATRAFPSTWSPSWAMYSRNEAVSS